MKSKTADRVATWAFWLTAAIILAVLALFVGYILYRGLPVLSPKFLFGRSESVRAGGGIGPQLFDSFYLLCLSTLFTVPLGVGAAIYLAEYARPGRLLELIRTSTETLASLPSIVAGLFGLLVFVNLTGWGYSLMAGALVLTLLNLPVMVRVTEDSLRAVPSSLREASLALGATKWQTIWHVLLPVALPGIVTGVIITAGRALGEAAALLYTAGQSVGALDFHNWDITSPRSPLNPFRPGETMAVHVWKVNTEGKIPDIRRVADGTAATLVLVVLLFNVAVRWFTHRLRRRLQGA
ncbi:MAG: phosphate transport system permease protein [Bacillota bacterium]|nr:phosphate transport system permease protein [Bacillota bacterium]MDK2925357.1 phosphate transport system permease protein [Bacillota bacterium]